MRGGSRQTRRESGQASVELLAVLPALIVCVVVAAHVLPSGFALWTAADAARTGARDRHIKGDGDKAARVKVDVPGLIPGAETRVEAASRLEPQP